MSRHLIVVGGGITGLAAAHAVVTDPWARAAGVRCTLVESDGRLGGKLLTERINGCLVENGPDSFLSTKPWAADLCRRLGLDGRLVPTQPGRAVYVWHRGRLHPLPEGMAFGIPTRMGPMMRTRLLSPAEKLRAAADLVLPRRGGSGDETIGGMLRRRLGDAVVDRLAGPLLGGIYAGDPDHLSVRATFPMLAEWETGHRSLILAALARRRARESPPAPPSGTSQQGSTAEGLAHQNSPSSMFLSLVGGLGEMVATLEATLEAAALLKGCTVERIVPRPGPCPGFRVMLHGGRMLEADALLLATPAYVSAGLLEPLAPAVAAALRSIPYVSTAAVTLAFRRAEVAHSLDGHGFVVARGSPLTITACTWASSKWPHRAPPEIALIRCYLGRAGGEEIVGEDDERLTAAARADLRTTMGIDAVPIFARVAKWFRAMPQYPPGHLDRVTAVEAGLKGLPNLALAGAGYRGIGIPDCIRQGTQAASRLIEALIRGTAR